MNRKDMTVIIHLATKPGVLKAFADLRLSFSNGELILHSFSVIQKEGKPAWVGFPQKPGNTSGRYFPMTEAEGELHSEIAAAILDAYNALV
jgi:hypothetical protein